MRKEAKKRLPTELFRHVFGRSRLPGNTDVEWRRRIEKEFGITLEDDPPGKRQPLTSKYFEQVRSIIHPNDLKSVHEMIVDDAVLDLPDARSSTFGQIGLIGIDFRLYLLVYNAMVLFLSLGGEGILRDGVPPLPFEARKRIDDALLTYIGNAAGGEIDVIDETQYLPSGDHFEYAGYLTTLVEFFMVAHEVGHIVSFPHLTAHFDSLFQDHSLVDGVGHDLGHDAPDEHVIESWVSEMLADRYGSLVLHAWLEQQGKGESHLDTFTLCFFFHLLDNYVKASIYHRGFTKAFYRIHPQPFVRLQACGVPHELFGPDVRYFGPQPYRSVAELFDFIGWSLNDLIKEKDEDYEHPFEWLRPPDDLMEKVVETMLTVEKSYLRVPPNMESLIVKMEGSMPRHTIRLEDIDATVARQVARTTMAADPRIKVVVGRCTSVRGLALGIENVELAGVIAALIQTVVTLYEIYLTSKKPLWNYSRLVDRVREIMANLNVKDFSVEAIRGFAHLRLRNGKRCVITIREKKGGRVFRISVNSEDDADVVRILSERIELVTQ